MAQIETEADVLITNRTDGKLRATLSVLGSLGGIVRRIPCPLSPVAGSELRLLTSPLAKVAVVPPTSDAVPLPMAGSVVPVVVLLSGTGELNVHCVMIVDVAAARCGATNAPATRSASVVSASSRRSAADGRGRDGIIRIVSLLLLLR